MRNAAQTAGVSLLIVGNLIGAGILGIPILAGIAGFWPSLIFMIISCVAMTYSALILAKRSCEEKDALFNYPSLYARTLGRLGKHVATITNALVLYGLLTAYIAGGSIILAQLFGQENPSTWLILTFFSAMTIMTLSGMRFMEKCNALFIFVLWAAFIVMIIFGTQQASLVNLKHMDLAFLLLAVPMIVTGFHFHNLIPSIATHVNYDKKTLYSAIIIGMSLGLVMNLTWLFVGTAVIPLFGPDSLIHSYLNGIPASVPMNNIIHSHTFIIASMIFSLLAILTSYVANAMGLLGFTYDLSVNFLNIKNRWFYIVLTFIPPLLIAFSFEHIFLKAIAIVGGIGIITLFGVLPAIIDYQGREKKLIPVVAGAFFSVMLLVQIFLDLHIITFIPPVS